jgi:hypothetical protein
MSARIPHRRQADFQAGTHAFVGQTPAQAAQSVHLSASMM